MRPPCQCLTCSRILRHLAPTGDNADELSLCSEQAEAQAELGAAAAALLCRVLKALALRAHADALRLARLVCSRCIGTGVAEAEDVRRALQLGLQAVLTDEPPSEVSAHPDGLPRTRAAVVCLGCAPWVARSSAAAEGLWAAALRGVQVGALSVAAHATESRLYKQRFFTTVAPPLLDSFGAAAPSEQADRLEVRE